jgi:hypothetical protein
VLEDSCLHGIRHMHGMKFGREARAFGQQWRKTVLTPDGRQGSGYIKTRNRHNLEKMQ